MRLRSTIRLLAIAAGVLLPATSATAQYTTDFESISVSAAGTVLTGQDGYYIPPATVSIDYLAFAYTGNALGIPQNPNGGANFIAGTGPGAGTFARAQRDMSYGAGTGVWTAGFDVLVTYTGLLPSAQNIGSFSIQPFPGSQSFISLARWTDATTAANWNADYIWFDAGGAQLTESVADVAFQTLDIDKWYRWETDFDLTTNEIVEVRLTDIAAGTTVTNNPVGKYMEGGAGGASTPTGFRFFAGGGVDGNTLAFDNASIVGDQIGTNFECPATVVNSSGNTATIAATGSDVAGDNNLTLTTTGLPVLPNSFGYFLNSLAQNPAGFTPMGSQGPLCIGPGGMGRYNASVFNSAGTGAGSLLLDLMNTPTPTGNVSIQPGETWYFTTWHRDANPGPTSNFSDAIGITFL